MEDVLISQETVKLANEKGFNEYTSRMESIYVILEDLWEQDHHNGNDFLMYTKDEIISSSEPPSHPGIKYKVIGKRPTQSILQKWLREKHKIYVEVYSHTNFGDECYEDEFEVMVHKKIFYEDVPVDGYYKTYEEALEIGLQEALKLIN